MLLTGNGSNRWSATPARTFGPMALHIGREILRVLEESGMPKTVFAERIGMNRSNVYDVFTAPGCDSVRLRKISQVLKCNFFKLLADDFEPSSVASEPAVTYGRPPLKPPMRIVIEVDQDNVAAKAEAERMAARIMHNSMAGTAPERDKAPRKVQGHTSRKPR